MFDFRRYLRICLDGLDLEVTVEAEDRLALYFSALEKWRKKVNLVSRQTTEREIVEKHFADSLMLLPVLQKPGCHLLDVGTGAGFPGLVCKAADPSLQLSLVEPRLKRVHFLRHITRLLDLRDVCLYSGRFEEIAEIRETPFSHITCRAFTSAGAFLQMLTHQLPGDGLVVLMRGPRWRKEMQDDVVKASCYRMLEVKEYVLPVSGGRRALLFFVRDDLSRKRCSGKTRSLAVECE